MSFAELGVVVAILGTPFVVSDAFTLDRLGKFLLLGLFAMSADVVWGGAGLVPFGHAVFFGWSGYAIAIVQDRWIDPPVPLLIAVVVGAGTAVGLAVLLSLFAFSRRSSLGGIYFAIVTLILAVISERFVNVASSYTGGKNGLPIDVSIGVGTTSLEFGRQFYWLAAGVVIVFYIATRFVMRGRWGRSLLSLRENERRLALLGYSTTRVKMSALVASAAVAGTAGAIYYAHDGIVSPAAVGITQSIFVLLWVLIGGVGTLLGPIVGAVLVNQLSADLSGRYLNTWLLIVGVLLVLALLFMPRGIFGNMQRAEEALHREQF